MNLTKSIKAMDHNTYSNPSIVEALCEIHYDCQTYPNTNSDTLFVKLKELLSPTYPCVTEQEHKQFQAAITDTGISVDEKKFETNRLIFKHCKRNHIIQFLPSVLTVNEMSTYPGWEIFLKDILHAWKNLSHCYNSTVIKQINLRYINLISRRNPKELLSNWFKPNVYYPDALLENTDNFWGRNEFVQRNGTRLIVTFLEPTQSTKGDIVFDIEIIAPFNQNLDCTRVC